MNNFKHLRMGSSLLALFSGIAALKGVHRLCLNRVNTAFTIGGGQRFHLAVKMFSSINR